MGRLTLYHAALSPHSRALLMIMRTLNIDVEIKNLNLRAKEQFNPDFLKLNPQHCVPTVIDGDFVIWESRATAIYLIESRAPNHPLYPRDIQKRARIDQNLYFVATYLHPRIRLASFNIAHGNDTKLTDEMAQGLKEGLDILTYYLKGNMYSVGDVPTIADYFTVASLGAVINADFVNFNEYPEIKAWYDRCKLLPGFDENDIGAKLYGSLIKQKIAANQ